CTLRNGQRHNERKVYAQAAVVPRPFRACDRTALDRPGHRRDRLAGIEFHDRQPAMGGIWSPALRGRTDPDLAGQAVAAGGQRRFSPMPRKWWARSLRPPYKKLRHGRACPGHPRLSFFLSAKTWMPGTSPGMTKEGKHRMTTKLFDLSGKVAVVTG